jgi:hypothetical protein
VERIRQHVLSHVAIILTIQQEHLQIRIAGIADIFDSFKSCNIIKDIAALLYPELVKNLELIRTEQGKQNRIHYTLIIQ